MKKLYLCIAAMLLSVSAFAQTMDIHINGSVISFPTKDISEVTFNDPEYLPAGVAVDLGLSVKWASCNLGTTDPEEIGYYLSWGESTEKENYDIQNYSLYDYTWQEYITSPDVLPSELDAATLLLGEDWRMPTKEEWEELYKECKLEIISYNGRTKGCKVTGPNGNKIFLPCYGYKAYEYFYKDTYYWTSSLDKSNKGSANAFYFWYSAASNYFAEGLKQISKHCGCFIRPVCK